MDKILVKGGNRLVGEICISGAKNSALKLYAAALLTDQEVVLHNIPNLHDMKSMQDLLEDLGCKVEISGYSGLTGSTKRVVKINASNIVSYEAPYELVRKMRASILVLGPLLARFKTAKVSLPGGCAIGTRPVNLHIMALEQMGAKIEIASGYLLAECPIGLVGAEIFFDKVSVGATENSMMAATLAKGKTILKNAAREPEIVDLANFLNAMGAKISGQGTDTITIEGVDKLHGAEYAVMGDRIEAGTYAVAAAITNGHINLIGVDPNILESMTFLLERAGAKLVKHANSLEVIADQPRPKALTASTAPYPLFATDLQAQLMALLTIAEGTSHISENIFENRFMHVPELNRMGAKITINDNTAIIEGVEKLVGAPVMATDLRASVSLVLAALVAEGETVINRVYHLDRGYEHLEEKLKVCGANIERVS